MLQSPAVFNYQNGYFYNPPPNAPPAYPNTLPSANTEEREHLQVENTLFYVHCANYFHTGRISVNIGAAAFDEWVLAALEDPDKGLNGVTICNVYNYVMGNQATISQAEVDDNLNKFNKPIDARQTLAIYIRKKKTLPGDDGRCTCTNHQGHQGHYTHRALRSDRWHG